MRADQTQPLRINGMLLAEAQDIGHGGQRVRLEDRCTAQRLRTAGGLDLDLALVADGVGGENAGEAASQIAMDAALESLRAGTGLEVNSLLGGAVQAAQSAVKTAAGSSPALRSMSTTLTVAAVSDRKLFLAHVGDSRAYLVRGEAIWQITLDHSWANEVVRLGKLNPEEASLHPSRNNLGRFIGQTAPLEVDIGLRFVDRLPPGAHPTQSPLLSDGFPLEPGDVVLLCSDGLVKARRSASGHFVELDEIVRVAGRKKNAPQDIANTLISLALGRLADDNVSVAILEAPGGVPLQAARGETAQLASTQMSAPRLAATQPSGAPPLPPVQSPPEIAQADSGRFAAPAVRGQPLPARLTDRRSARSLALPVFLGVLFGTFLVGVLALVTWLFLLPAITHRPGPLSALFPQGATATLRASPVTPAPADPSAARQTAVPMPIALLQEGELAAQEATGETESWRSGSAIDGGEDLWISVTSPRAIMQFLPGGSAYLAQGAQFSLSADGKSLSLRKGAVLLVNTLQVEGGCALPACQPPVVLARLDGISPIMGLIIPEEGGMVVDCLSGSCQVVNGGNGGRVSLLSGQRGGLRGAALLNEQPDMEFWRALCPECSFPASPLVSASQTLAPTATRTPAGLLQGSETPVSPQRPRPTPTRSILPTLKPTISLPTLPSGTEAPPPSPHP